MNAVAEARNAHEQAVATWSEAMDALADAENACAKAEVEHDTLMNRAYNGDDTVPWAAVMRAEKLVKTCRTQQAAAQATLRGAESNVKETAAAAIREEASEDLTTGAAATELKQAWGAYQQAVIAVRAPADELRTKAPHGRSAASGAEEWAAQQSLDRSNGALSFAAANKLAHEVSLMIRAAYEARRRFNAAVGPYNQRLDEAVRTLQRQGHIECLIDDGRAGYQHGDRVISRCDPSSRQAELLAESLEISRHNHASAAAQMRHHDAAAQARKPIPTPVEPLSPEFPPVAAPELADGDPRIAFARAFAARG